MKSIQKNPSQPKQPVAQKSLNHSDITALAISRKLIEIKRISGAGEMTELNMALWKHLR
jgi:hypothetical protein